MFTRLVCVVGLLVAVWAPAASASPRPPMSSVSASDVSVAPGLPVAIAATPDGQGFWVVSPTGAVTAEGDATFYGDASHLGLNQPIVGIATTPTGHGYWLVAADGGIFTYGDATFHGSTGSTHLNQPIVGIAATPTGHGYWLVAADGGIFSFGDATFHGSTGSTHLNQPIVGIAATPTGDGYWLVAADGGIFSFGDATFHGSTGSTHLNQPIVGIAATPTGDGYWLVAADGGTFTYGDATFHGSGADQPSPAPALGFIDTAGTAGYWIALTNGEVRAFGTANDLITVPIVDNSACIGNPTGEKLLFVSLSQQALWACEGNTLVSYAPVTTGASALTNVHDATPTGTWRITSKTTNVYLSGCDANGCWHDFVHYWIPFDGAYGFHDAPWQAFPFGSPLYTTQGSHGCVHLPEAEATWLYGWAPIGTAVTIQA